MKTVRLQLGILLAADATTLAPATNANKIALIVAPFTLAETLTVSALTLASSGGLAPIACATGDQEVATDPVTGDQLITLVPGAGSGFRWVSAGATYPTTVYGAALTDSTGANLFGAMALAQPISLTADGQQINLTPQTMTFVLQPIS